MEMTIEQQRAVAMAQARLRLQGGSQPATVETSPEPEPMGWGDAAMKAVGNIPSSGAKFAKDILGHIKYANWLAHTHPPLAVAELAS